jgi:glycosyltransferase involved in cell wall biosynthesis
MENPLVSVIIPTYGRPKFLKRAVESALKQTYDNIEVVVVNDDPSLDVSQILENLSVKIISHGENKGGSAARNTGIKNSNGVFIAFLDDDDLWYEDKIEKQLKIFLEQPSVAAVYTGLKAVTEDGVGFGDTMPEHEGFILDVLLSGNYVGATSTVMVKKDVLVEVGLFDEKFPSAQDWELWIRIAEKHTFGFVDEVLAEQTVHGIDRISSNKQARYLGYKMISEKYIHLIKKSPRKVQAEHELYIGVIFFKARYLRQSLVKFVKSIYLHPPLIIELIKLTYNFFGKNL